MITVTRIPIPARPARTCSGCSVTKAVCAAPVLWNQYRQLSVFVANRRRRDADLTEATMHGIIYLVGLVVVILAILSFFGLR